MNDYLASAARKRSIKRAQLTVILCGSLLTMPGCGIPGLRCALPGPTLPDSYNWSNGAAYWNGNAAPEPLGSKSDSVRPASTGPNDGGVVRVASTPAGFGMGWDEKAADPATDATGLDDDHTDPSEAPGDLGGFANFIKAASYLKLPKADSSDADELNGEGDVTVERIATPQIGDGTISPDPNFADANRPDPNRADRNRANSGAGTAVAENSAQTPQTAFFTDPYLSDLIEQALVGNQELRILAEEIQIANNETYARSGEYRPFVTLGGGAELEKASRFTREGAVEEQLEVAPGRGFPDPLPNFMVAADVSWELDIWKRLRNAQDAAALRYLATQDGRNYIVTRLVAEVAENYFDLLALDNRLQIVDRTIEIQQLSLEIAEAQKAAGRGTELAVQRFEAEVKKNQSEKSIIAQEIVEVENRINFLVGRFPQPVARPTVQFVDLHLNALSAGVPSQLLQNRADIRQAEREVAAAGLDVRVARARFYPSLTLTGGLGWEAFSTGYLFKSPESLIYSVAGELVGPLINKRAIQANYSSANAAQLQRIYEYQQTVLTAHIEVVNYITRVENYRRSIEAKKQQLEALEAAVESATQLFQSARAEYLEVLLAQRELMEARMVLVDAKQEQLSAIVNAYQALGGGGF